MGKVLKSDASAAAAWVEKNLGSGQPDLWLTVRMSIDADTRDEWEAGASGYLLMMFMAAHGPFEFQEADALAGILGVLNWSDWWSGSNSPGPTDDSWIDVEIHHVTGGASELYVNTVLLLSGIDDGAGDVQIVRIGQYSPNPGTNVCYFDDVKVGTTRGGEDLFADDFEDGTLDAWTSDTGDVSVVDDPNPPPPSGAFSLPLAVAFEVRGGSPFRLTLTPAAEESLTLVPV